MKLDVKSRPDSSSLTTATPQEVKHDGRGIDIKDKSVSDEGDEIDLMKDCSVRHLPISLNSPAKARDFQKFHHLVDIKLTEINNNDVLLLTCTDTPTSQIPLEVRSGSSMDQYAIRTQLGWVVRWKIMMTDIEDEVHVNFGKSDDILLQQLERLWTTNFGDNTVHIRERQYRLIHDEVNYCI